MIKPNHFQIAAARVFFASHQLCGLDQKPVSLGALFARVRDRVSLVYELSVRGVSAQEKPAAFIRVIAHAVLANLGKQMFGNRNHQSTDRPCSMSAMMSSMLSIPTEMRTRPSTIP